jgi:hypothetical protein
MPYPTSCGTTGTITDISLGCLNDLLSENGCTTTFAKTSDPHAFTFVGGPPGLIPYSTYGQQLSVVQANMSLVANHPSLCQKGTYIKTNANSSNSEIINGYNAELNGLIAQYTLLYNQYTALLIKRVPSILTTGTGTTTTSTTTTSTTAPAITTPTSTTRAEIASAAAAASTTSTDTNAFSSTLVSIQTAIDALYPQILNMVKKINTAAAQVSAEDTINTSTIKTNAENLLNKINDMNVAFKNLNDYNEQNKSHGQLDGIYENTQIETSSSYMKYMLYILFTLFVIGCLVFIYLSPSEGKLDMFILALGVIILVYYIYNYFETRHK